MNPIIESFHIDAGLLIAQVINFSIVLAVLYFFVVKPLTSVLEKRAQTVEKGIADAREADERLKKAQSDYEEKLIEAKKEAHTLLEKAKEESEKNRLLAIADMKAEMEREAEKERVRMAQEKEDLRTDIRNETAELIVLSLEKVLGKSIDENTRTALIEEVYDEKSSA